ncbi:MAG: HIRAN domain-containing protein [Pseudomonadota bacterium]|nr:HIRAN domain-containing protein [Pseudomonadota bacterium]
MTERTYSVGVVGEQNYQAAISLCKVGDRVALFHEIGNPHDEDAIVVLSRAGHTIGYIPRDCFVQQVVHDQGRACAAIIQKLTIGKRDFVEIVLEVSIVDVETGTIPYRR